MKLEEEIKQRKFESPAQKAVLNVMFTANWLSTAFRDNFKPFGITAQQYNVLRILRGRYPNAANPSEIKEVMLDKNPDLTRLCDRLCAAGFIKRTIDDANRRKMNIIISQKGLDLLANMDDKVRESQKQMNHLSEKECETLSSLLDKMRG
ncbi:MAG: MarR family transcriptional regulator [Bacteroidetes bacterium]|nr:MarR family transcriptional regulator [Bacteroidota bacterium]